MFLGSVFSVRGLGSRAEGSKFRVSEHLILFYAIWGEICFPIASSGRMFKGRGACEEGPAPPPEGISGSVRDVRLALGYTYSSSSNTENSPNLKP